MDDILSLHAPYITPRNSCVGSQDTRWITSPYVVDQGGPEAAPGLEQPAGVVPALQATVRTGSRPGVSVFARYGKQPCKPTVRGGKSVGTPAAAYNISYMKFRLWYPADGAVHP